MRSTKPHTITVNVVTLSADRPPFIGVLHRHFQKSLPAVLPDARGVTLIAPVDLLSFLVPEPLLKGIASIEVIYGK